MTTDVVRVAAFDCGTNAIRLLVADVSVGSAEPISDVVRDMRIVRLGEGVDRTGEFSPAALARLFEALTEFGEVMDQTSPERVRFVATSASRDVSNRAEFAEGVARIVGVAPEVITGHEEAELSYLGAVIGLPHLPAPPLVFDIGGGSTEFILGGTNGAPAISTSVNIGCVRLSERHLHSDPASSAEIARVRADAREAIERAAATVPLSSAACLVGLSGTMTTVAAMAHGHEVYEPALLHGLVVSREQVDDVTARLLAMSSAERAALPFMHPGRVEVIGAGSLILQAVLEAAGAAEVITSEADLLDGIAFRLAGG